MDSPVFADLANFEEDDRIAIIARHVRKNYRIAFVVDTTEAADRYIAKLKKRLPASAVYGKTSTPLVSNTVTVIVQLQNPSNG